MRHSTIERATPPPEPENARRTSRERLFTRLLVLVTALLVIAMGTNAVLLVRDQHRFPPPGNLIQLSDGRVLHLDVSGVSDNGPSVILDGEHGTFSPAMRHLQQALSEKVLVVSYDRPGYGWSDPVNADRDPIGVVGDLHEALARASVPGPYIMVGHSLGALYARGFASSYPEDVVGLILVDPAHEDQLDRLPDDVVGTMSPPQWLAGPMLAAAHLGVLRVLKPGASAQRRDCLRTPPPSSGRCPSLLGTCRPTLQNPATSSGSPPRSPPSPNHPTVVLNALVAIPGLKLARPAMNEMNREFGRQFANVSLIEVDGADHTSIVTDPAHPRHVASAVLDLHRSVDQAHTSQ